MHAEDLLVNSEPKDVLTYDQMRDHLRSRLRLFKLNRYAKEIGVKYRLLRLLCKDPDYRPGIDVVNDVYRRVIWEDHDKLSETKGAINE